jgi:hypothetical protein
MKKFLKIIMAVALAVCFVLPVVGCDTGASSTSEPGLKYKKIGGVYTVYDYVQEEGVTTLDLGEKLPADVTNVRIKKGAFAGNATLTKIIVSDKITKIDKGAFEKMGALVTLEVPFIGKSAHSDVIVGETAKGEDKAVDAERTIAHFFGADEYDAGIAITVKHNVNDSTTCYMPLSFKEVIVNATSDYSIPMYAFNGAVNLSSIKLVGKIDLIGESAFDGVKELKEIEIPETVTKIYSGAFANCSKLATLKFSGISTLKEVEENAFANTALKDTALDGVLVLTAEQKADIFGK